MATNGRQRPALMMRLAAAMQGEVAATTVDAYRRAGAAAYQDLLDAEQLRADLTASGGTVWTTQPSQASQLLCAWNAFALQTLGDELVEAATRADPGTAGYLPPVTAEQAAAFLGEVGHWSARARRAASDETYDVRGEISLPARLPAWVKAEPCPPVHLKAMLAAARAMRGRAEAALDDLVKTPPPDGHADVVSRLRGLAAETDSVVSFGESMWNPDSGREANEQVEDALRRGISAYYRLGQWLAMPTLVGRPEQAPAPVTGLRPPLPGQHGFDPWCLTDPASLSHWQHDHAARQAVSLLWQCDPDPAATLGIQAEIDAAAAEGSVVLIATISQMPSHYSRCPWSAIYLVRHPVTIAGQALRPMQQFTFDVSADRFERGGPFVRRLLLGPFHPAAG
jgi:hypothetical protein